MRAKLLSTIVYVDKLLVKINWQHIFHFHYTSAIYKKVVEIGLKNLFSENTNHQINGQIFAQSSNVYKILDMLRKQETLTANISLKEWI